MKTNNKSFKYCEHWIKRKIRRSLLYFILFDIAFVLMTFDYFQNNSQQYLYTGVSILIVAVFTLFASIHVKTNFNSYKQQMIILTPKEINIYMMNKLVEAIKLQDISEIFVSKKYFHGSIKEITILWLNNNSVTSKKIEGLEDIRIFYDKMANQITRT